ncbi:CaiB/BaiF CoA-transferase family protein [Streptomyces sp. NBC_00268]|uniref:CaiB/BaiF CoA transferase family protein n=1 Tax=Streptomyces sp. NBC_00268 TaxID=2975695 RepID=UPI002253C391|nr:CaiB/BaiF CoA-transferase family protein [Streptomyces sp. NBC_00268]MCX5189375.1 CoA transferase [Streptomyces sp. NBC_00268]
MNDSRNTDSSSCVLNGVRVLELGNFIAAPSAGRLLADFGADVIKVERPNTGDELRRWRVHSSDTSLLFRLLNRNKKSVTLDLSTEEGRDICLRLVRKSDIVLENFRPGTLERWGLGPDVLRSARPDLVLVRISGYGQSGPYRDKPGFGGVAEAFGGLRNLAGFPDRPPVRAGVSLADSVASLYAVIGALMGLIKRGTTGRGESVDVALYEAVFSLTESLIPDFDAFGVVPQRSGSALAGIVPSNTYRCADGAYVVISGNSTPVFKRLMVAIGRPDLADEPSLADNAGRVSRAEELDAAISTWAARRASEMVLQDLEQAQVPADVILTAAEILENAHYNERGMLESHPVEINGRTTPVTFPGVVPKLNDAPGRTRWIGPDLGKDTDAVLGELGINKQVLSRLRNCHVI